MSLVILLSCSQAATTTITGTWKDPGANSYKDFFVIVLTKNLPARQTLEKDIYYKLKKEGAKGAMSLEIFPHSEKPATQEERDAIVEKIQSLGHDAIVTVVLKKATEESRYVPGTTQYAPTSIGYGTGYNNQLYQSAAGPGYYGSFGGYYNYNYSMSSADGYYDQQKTYFVESNLYDARTAKLVWSAQSETFNPLNLEAASADFSKVMVSALQKEKLIFSKEKESK